MSVGGVRYWLAHRGISIGMTTAQFQILYDGPALETHEMEIRDLAPALLAFNDLIQEANSIVNGDRAEVSVQVKGSFKTGSFGIDLTVAQSVSELWARSVPWLTTTGVVAAATLLTILGINVTNGSKGVLQFLRWLRGRPITNVKILDHENVQVFVGDDTLVIEQRVLDCFRSYKLRRAFESAISRPLDREGIDEFAIARGNGEFETVTKEERSHFNAPLEHEEFPEQVYESEVHILTISFREGNRWRFSDGDTSFSASVKDDDFIQRVQKNVEAFSKDDLLRVRIRRKQWTEKGVLKTDHEVLKVIDHRRVSPQVQLNIEIDNPDQP